MPRKRTGLKIALGIGIAILSCYLLFSLRAHLVLKHELELARQEGLWTTLDDIANRPAPPVDRNAALIYTPLCISFHDAVPLVSEVDKALDPGGEAAFEAAYRLAEPYLRDFERAAAMPDCQFQRNWRAGALVLFPELAGIKGPLKLICIQATLMSRHGHAAEALDLIRRFAPMARHAGSDPILIGELVEISMDAIAFRAIQTILGAHGLEPRVLEHAKSALAALGPPPDALSALKGECAMSDSAFDDPAVLAMYQLNGWTAFLSHIPAARDVWAADVVRDYRTAYAGIKETQPDTRATLARLKGQQAGRSEFLDSFTPGSGGWYEAVARDAANRAALSALIAGLEGWRKSGACPTTQSATPLDPRTDAPLKFAKIKGGFKVWCIASDGTDHGGVAYDPGGGRSLDQCDTVYAYPWTPPVKKKAK